MHLTPIAREQTPMWTFFFLILLKFGGDVAFTVKLHHTKFQEDISNGIQMARVQSFQFFLVFREKSFFVNGHNF
jgi:hypothetical protein